MTARTASIAERQAYRRLVQRLAFLQRSLERGAAEVNALTQGEADEFLSQHPADLGAAHELTEQAVTNRELVRREIAQVQQALRRVEHGTYGICEDCRSAIPDERLDVLPYATRCVACARALERPA